MPSNFSRFGLAPRFAARQGGFTLVELITVIVILGVLAAVALPRFASLGGSARAAKASAMGGAIKAAAALAKAQAVANGVSCGAATGTSVTLEGATVALNYCYPQATAAAILAAANINIPGGGTGVDGMTVSAAGAATGGSAITLQIDGATTAASCQITYTSPSVANTPPEVVIVNNDC